VNDKDEDNEKLIAKIRGEIQAANSVLQGLQKKLNEMLLSMTDSCDSDGK
jgi:hypothetical protein